MSVREVAELLGLNRITVYNAIENGELNAIRIGRRILVLRKAIEDLLQRGNTTHRS